MYLASIRTFGLLFIFTFFAFIHAGAQKTNSAYQDYIKVYSNLAMKHQKEYGIPASIKLAQAIMESGGGKSPLALKSNNHFGIKCHGWKGASVSHDDDLNGECFRKYSKVEDSYRDHSLFLTQRAHYKNLFKLKIDDYKGWAKGLQASGYATSKTYASTLIRLIEDYELYKYDKEKPQPPVIAKKHDSENLHSGTVPVTSKDPETKPSSLDKVVRRIYRLHGLDHVFAIDNDSFEKIANVLDLKEKDLLKFNEVSAGFPLRKGDIVFLEMKKKKADKPHYDHEVRRGESMYSISQNYSIQLKSLYKINKKKADYTPKTGDILRLR